LDFEIGQKPLSGHQALWNLISFALKYLSTNFISLGNDDKGGLLYASDMLLTPKQRIIVETGGDLSKDGSVQARATMSSEKVLWLPNDKTVPYTIDHELGKELKIAY